MRIMLVGPARSIHVRRWGEFLAGRGHEVIIVSEHAPDLPLAATSLTLPGKRLPRALRYLLGAPWLRWQVHRLRPDVIHVQSAGSNAALVALLPGRHLVVTPWGSEVRHLASRARGRIVRSVLRRAALVLTTSEHMRRVMSRAGVRPDRVRAVSWGIDPELFVPLEGRHRAEERARWNLPPPPTRVIVAHRSIGPVYRTLEIVRAFRSAAREAPDLCLVLLRGWEPDDRRARDLQRRYRERVYRLVREEPGLEVVLFDRPLAPPEVASLLSAADAAISVPTFDQRSSSVLEAIASGVRVLASNIEPYRELVAQGANLELLDEPLEPRLRQAFVEVTPPEDAERMAAHRLMASIESWPRQSLAIEEALAQVAR